MDRIIKGLPGLNNISEQERKQFMLDNEEKLRKYRTASQRQKAAEILYNNTQFKNAFGDEAFKQAKSAGYDLNARNQMLEAKVIGDKAKEYFGRDKDFQFLSSQLDTQGWKDLLNSDYTGTEERQKRLAIELKSASNIGKSFDKATQAPVFNSMQPALFSGMKVGATASAYNCDEDIAEKDKEIREKLFADTQKRREEGVQTAADNLYNAMISADTRGEKSLSAFYADFDKLASGKDKDGVPYSPHYAAFKNTKWLEDYTNEDRLRDYAKYQALKQQYGESIARQYLDRTIQNKVAEAQDGTFTGNTLKKIGTTIWSDLGSNIALMNNISKSPEEIGILNEGKDPNKPIYDTRGNIVDYEKSDAVWTNPAYWNNVYKYNTFSPTEIKAIEERGGISEDVNVREYGHVPDFLSWETVQEGISQAGHIAAFGIESYLTGSVGKLIGMAGKTAMKGVGLGAKTMAKASKVGNITNDLFVTFAGAASGAQMEAMGTFEEQMQVAKDRIEEQKRHELQDYYNTINYDTPEAKETIAGYFDTLKRQDKRRVATGSTDGGGTPLPQSDEQLMQQAKQQYVNQLLEAKQQELEDLHKGDLEAARRAATKAYGTNFFMDWVKDAPFDLALRKFQYAKGSLTGAFDNAIEKGILTDATTGGVKRGKKLTSAMNVAKEFGKEIGGGFADEYLDGLNSSFAGGIGSHDFENYINKTYNPELYNAATEGLLGNLIAGFSAGIDGLTERNNLYEGFIGGVSAGSSVMVSPNAVFHPKDTWKAVVSGVDAAGNKLSGAEILATVLTNPLLSTYAELEEKDRAIDNTVETINQVIAANKDRLGDASKILAAMDDYSSPLHRFRFVGSEEGEEGSETSSKSDEEGKTTINSPSLLDSQDQKLYNAFTLMETLSALDGIQGGGQSALYQQAMNTIQGLAEKTLSEEEQAEEIDNFLAMPENKSILDSPNGREIAAERLQKNAQYLLNTQQKIAEVRSMIDRNPGMKEVDGKVKTLLTYNLVAKDDYQKRLETLEKELGDISHSNPDALFTPDFTARYGTVKAAENAVSARDRELGKIQQEKEEVKKGIEDAQKKGQEALVKSRQFQLASLEEREQAIQEEKEGIAEMVSHATEGIGEVKNKGKLETAQFTEEYILGLDARDKAEVFNPANKDNYTKKQQKVIEHVRKKLMQQDPSAMQKIHDAGVLANRIADLNTVQDKLMQNSELAATYLDAVEQRRTALAMAESIQEGINQHYGKIERAYDNLYERKPRNVAKREQEFKQAVTATNSRILKAYMEDHEEQAEKVIPLYELVKLNEDAAAIIGESEESDATKLLTLGAVMGMNDQANTREEGVNYLERMVDDTNVPEVVRGQVDKLLDGLKNLGYQRDATVIENRKQRKEREEAQRKAEEERKKQLEAAVKEAEAKKADEDAKRKAEEEEKKKKNDDGTSDTDFSDSEFKEQETGTIQLPPSTDANLDSLSGKSTGEPAGTVAEDVAETKEEKASEPIDVLVAWAEGKISGEDAIKQLDGTEYVKHTKGNKALGTRDGVHFSNKVEWELGKYIKEKYPFLTYGNVSVATGVSTFGGNMNLTVIRDAEGNEYGTPSNFLRSLATNPDGKAAEAVKKGLQSAQQNAESSVNNIMEVHDEVLGDVIQGQTPSLEEQVTEAQREGQGEVQDVAGLVDSDKENSRGEEAIETSPTTLNGVAMNEWVVNKDLENAKQAKNGSSVKYDKDLSHDHVLVHKKGGKEGDKMNQFYDWLKNAGIKRRNITDDELPRILAQNPHVPVKFMRLRPDGKVGSFRDNLLMLVIDYTDDVAKIHNDENGGVITSDDKKYLVIGEVGYGDEKKNPDKFNLWKLLMDNYAPNSHKLKVKAHEWFKQDAHKSEMYYVHPDFHTEIVQGSMIPGYLIRQNLTDETEKERSIKELLNDKERNPHGYKLENLGWGIHTQTSFWTIKTGGKQVMEPEHTVDNLGRVFVLIPAGNGKLIPAKIEPLHYADGMDENGNIVNPNALNRNSVLWNRIQDLLNQLTSPRYDDRRAAISQLASLLYFAPKEQGNKTILIGTDEHDNRVTVVNGEQRTTFFLDSNFDREAFFKAVREMNPRINVTPGALSNIDKLKELEEIGALKTDIAKLGTSGVSYSIYGIDSDGNMIVPEKPTSAKIEEPSGNSESNVREFRYLYNANYKYNTATGEFTKDGVPVTGDDMIEYAYKIGTQQVAPVKQEGVWQYYIISTGEHPEVVKQNNVGRIEQLSEKEAQKVIDDEVARIAEEKRRLALEQALAEQQSTEEQEGEPAIDEDGGLSFFEEEDTSKANEGIGESQPVTSKPSTSSASVEGSVTQGGTRTFKQLWRSRDIDKVLDIIKQKDWQNIPMEDMNKLKKYLEDKGMKNLDMIGTSEADFKAWLQKLRCL